jgi:hypothetical protein
LKSPEDAKDKIVGSKSRDLTPEGCLILTLSLLAMAGFVKPILSLACQLGSRVHTLVPAMAIVASGAIACALGAGVLRLLGLSMWKETKNRRDQDLE